MRAHVIDGRAYAADLRQQIAADAHALAVAGARPGLATIIAGADYAACAYERRVRTLAGALGCRYACEELPPDASEAGALAAVGTLNADPRISGILILRPLPPQISEAVLYRALDPAKDIEAVHPLNAGLLALGRPRYVPSTPASVFYMLDRYLAGSGRDAAEVYERSTIVVIGRSGNVGRPAILLGLARNATVISCDEHTFKAGLLHQHTAAADILIVAAGVPGLITADHVKDGVIAIDVGINPVEDPRTGKTRLTGDIDFRSVTSKAEAISPVPGGVGPITDTWLLRNTVTAARHTLGTVPALPCPQGRDSGPAAASLPVPDTPGPLDPPGCRG